MGNCCSLYGCCCCCFCNTKKKHNNKNTRQQYVVEVAKERVSTGRADLISPPKLTVANSGIGGSAVNAPVSARDVDELRQVPGHGNVTIFTYNEMKSATRNFRPDQILGEGGFGIVYKGIIDESVKHGFQYTQVAVKELDQEGFQGDREWLTEVNYLGQLSHPNLVKLVGYCCEDEHRLLVYEYMACGSLEKHLFRRACLPMTWTTRMKIALGAARGLAFLHGLGRPIIYRDFKTSNILLDADYNSKLSDFGLAKEGPMGDQTHVSTRVMGTYGYAAPEYIMTGHLTAKSDVYGFGVVLLEMLIGRRAMDKSRPSREHNLVEWARPLLIRPNKLLRIVDPRMEGQYSNKMIQKVASLAYQCLSPNPKGRPVMSEVVDILEPFQDMPESGEDVLLQGSGGNAVTLYEVPTEATDRAEDHEKRHQQQQQDLIGGKEANEGRKRSKSEVPAECDRYIPSPGSDGQPEPIRSTSASAVAAVRLDLPDLPAVDHG